MIDYECKCPERSYGIHYNECSWDYPYGYDRILFQGPIYLKWNDYWKAELECYMFTHAGLIPFGFRRGNDSITFN